MSQETLVQALQNTLAAAIDVRHQAEQYLEQCSLQQGFLPVLLQVISAQELDVNVRMASAVYFKNVVQKEWPLRTQRKSTLSDPDRDMVRKMCLELILTTDGVVQKNIQECLRIIISNDYPERFPDLVSILVSIIQNAGADNKKIYGALLGCRVLAKKFEFYYDEKSRVNLNTVIVPSLFPMMVTMYEQLLDVCSMESFVMQNVMSKIFFSVIRTSMPPTLISDTQLLQRWLSILLRVLDRRLPDEMLPADPDQRFAHPFWKNHKRVSMIIVRLFQKYAKKATATTSEQEKWFSEVLEKQYATGCIEGMWKLLQLKSEGKYLPDIVCMYCFDFIDTLVRFGKHTRAMIMPQIDTLMFTMIFPELCFSQEDQDSWDEDPHDYVFRTLDLVADFTSCRVSARDLLLHLLRKNNDAFEKYVQFCNAQLAQYQADPSVENARRKDGVLMSLGAMEGRLVKHPTYAKALPQLIMTHVAPEIESRYGFLRSRACCTIAEFARAEMNYPDSVIHSLLNRLTDPELPVQVQAALSLRRLLQVCATAKELVRPMLPTLLEQFLKLINDIDNDDVIDALKQIVDSYGDEMKPYAAGLVNFLSDHFLRLANTEDEGDIGLAAVACLKTLCSVLECIAGQPETYAMLEQPLYKVFEFVFGDTDTFLEEGIELATTLTYCNPKMTPMMWEMYKKVYGSFMQDTMDCYAKDYLHVFDNVISRDPAAFVSGGDGTTTYIRMMYNMVEKVFHHQQFEDVTGEEDKIPMAKLLYSIYHHCKGIEDYMEPFTKLVLEQLFTNSADGQPRSEDFQAVLLTVLASGLYYNAALQLQLIGQHLTQFLQMWMTAIPKFESKLQKKIAILGLSSLFAIPDQLPDVLKNNMQMLVEGVVTLSSALDKQREDEEGEGDGDDDEAEEDKDGGSGSDDDYGEDDDDIDDDIFDQFFDDDDEYYESPLDDLDEVVVFAQTLQRLGEANPQFASGLNNALSGELQGKVQALVASAGERAYKLQQRIAEEQQPQPQQQQ